MTEAAGKIDAKRDFPWGKAVRAFISVAVVAAIFVFAIPKFASYSDVWPILAGLSAAQIVWLLLAQFLSRAAYWSVYMASLPGLRFWPSAVLIQTNSAMASVLPAGGAFAVGITYEMLGSWGFSNASVTELIGVSGIWNFGVKLTMPTVSVLLLLATGVKSHQLVVAAAAGLGICLVAGVVIGLVLWKEQVASALGSIADRVATWFLRPFRKGPVTSLEPALVEIRRQTIEVARTRWFWLTVFVYLEPAGCVSGVCLVDAVRRHSHFEGQPGGRVRRFHVRDARGKRSGHARRPGYRRCGVHRRDGGRRSPV